jgi:hypothetical protein
MGKAVPGGIIDMPSDLPAASQDLLTSDIWNLFAL